MEIILYLQKIQQNFIMASDFAIIQALCRSALSSSREMIEHQMERLIDNYKNTGQEKEAKSIEGILLSAQRTQPVIPVNIAVSSLEGETLTRHVSIPVDKETSTPILEVIMAEEIDGEQPLFNDTIQLAVESVISEWGNYDKLIQLQASPSRSCLIFGDPGTGKTMLAKWIAKSVGLPVVLAKLDGIISSFLGTSSRNIANLFRFANKYRCILLLDEFDALAKLRDDPQEIGEVKRIVNTLLQNLDIRSQLGFTIGITNHEKLLDPAVWRRFDVQIMLPHPHSDVRKTMLAKFIQPLEYSEPELSFINWCMKDATGADLRKLCDWLKRSSILNNNNQSIVDLMSQFAIMNTGRINGEITSLLNHGATELCQVLVEDESIGLKQKDIATLLGIAPSTLSKLISKNNSHGRKSDSTGN